MSKATKTATALKTAPAVEVKETEMGRSVLPEIKPNSQSQVGEFLIANRGLLPVTVSLGTKGGYRYKIAGIQVTAILRWIGFVENGNLGWDIARAFLSLQGLGDAVKDNTVGAQTSSGRLVANGGKSNHGPIPTESEMGKETVAALKTMLEMVRPAATKGREMRRAGTMVEVATETGKGKNKKIVPVETAFNWRTFGSAFVATESGTVKAKKPAAKKPAAKK